MYAIADPQPNASAARISARTTDMDTISTESRLLKPGNVAAMPGAAMIDLAGLRARREEILARAAERGARNVRVFGSTATGLRDASSDIDLLVEMEPGRSLLDLVGLGQDLEDLLGTRVDVLSEGGMSPYLRDRILAEARAL
jgi:predicted nucleotidyltransferase